MVEYKRNSNTICFLCKKSIYRRPAQMSKGNVFCSMNCYGLFCRKEVPCAVCRKLILAGLNKKTCSRTCSNKYRTGVKYKIGKPNEKSNIVRILKFKLKKERGNKCERCNYNKYEILQVHHKDRNRKNNELNNLELICPNCHYEKHILKKS